MDDKNYKLRINKNLIMRQAHKTGQGANILQISDAGGIRYATLYGALNGAHYPNDYNLIAILQAAGFNNYDIMNMRLKDIFTLYHDDKPISNEALLYEHLSQNPALDASILKNNNKQ